MLKNTGLLGQASNTTSDLAGTTISKAVGGIGQCWEHMTLDLS
jgi:hypothetical protein